MRISLIILLIALLLQGCTKSFELPSKEIINPILVVEGDIKTGELVENSIKLSRTKALFEVNDIPETNSLVEIQVQNGPRYVLRHRGNGVYSEKLQLPASTPASLRIQTADGKIYETPFQKPVETPDIDSITWKQGAGFGADVNIFIHTRDPKNKTRNYKWSYTETWERRAWYESLFEFRNGEIVYRAAGDQISTCWQTKEGSTFEIANTNDLQDDVVSFKPIFTIPFATERIYVRYSMLVRQIGLSPEAYTYWETLKKNTELRGTLFDPQPSRLTTNITCTNDKSKEVIGFISVGRVAEKRLFIMNSAVNLWPSRNQLEACDAFEFPKFQAERFLSQNQNYLPAYFVTAGGGYGVAIKQCVDCRLGGGVNIKPDFW
jgi:hypothetical protein